MDGFFTLANSLIVGFFSLAGILVPLIWRKYFENDSPQTSDVNSSEVTVSKVKSGRAAVPVAVKSVLAGFVAFLLAVLVLATISHFRVATPQAASQAADKEDSVSMSQFFAEYDVAPFKAVKQHIGKQVTWDGYFTGYSGTCQGL